MDAASSVTAKGNGAANHEGESRSVAPRLTEKMLAAKREMSNIFLHLRQNIDIARKKAPRRDQSYGSGGPLLLYFP
jgi:hypothetical protein